ncbi:putative DNA methyltransferase YeeA [Arthrobacter sp. Hiyo1]|nr:putative DNA methyltransferase YeeA [Arthrobacter sp. Hiyo1]
MPLFTKKAREELINAGKLIWREINPDIFGSMFQAIVTPGKRSDLGQHYTSVPNILKTIEPLFLNALKDELDESFDSVKKLETLLDRISAIKVFDPACGSGNFLIIAYKELRKLEHAILERLAELDDKHLVLFAESRINIENFFGIEIDDFAVEVAILSLWIAKHQMNTEFKEKFNVSIPLIPLKETGQIKQGNATRVDWNDVCSNDGGEIYLIGNPPYKGGKSQKAEMKADYPFVFGRRPYSKDLDYIALWFIKGADYIEGTRAELAFVSTNSVTQGEHVGLMFPMIFTKDIEIGYAYTSFNWENNAKRNAGVTVVVIGLRMASSEPKYIYSDGLQIEATNINGYLADASSVFVYRRTAALSPSLPRMALAPCQRTAAISSSNRGTATRFWISTLRRHATSSASQALRSSLTTSSATACGSQTTSWKRPRRSLRSRSAWKRCQNGGSRARQRRPWTTRSTRIGSSRTPTNRPSPSWSRVSRPHVGATSPWATSTPG